MRNSIEPIMIRVELKEVPNETKHLSPRERFWAVLKRQQEYMEKPIWSFETMITRQLGQRLHMLLVNTLTEGIRDTERAMYGPEIETMLREYRHFFPEFFFRERKEWPPFYPLDPLSKIVELRQQIFREIPAVRDTLEHITLTSQIYFSVRIDGYSSLNLSLLVSQLEKLVKLFDSDFESFRVFLDAFIPQAFGDVFDDGFADQLSFDVAIPKSFQNVFEQSSDEVSGVTHPQPTINVSKETTSTESDKRAKWLWWLANGSLLIPVLLALIVLYFGLKEIGSLRTMQYEALKPILEHQLQLLKEDRERMRIQTPLQQFGSVSPVASQGRTTCQQPVSNPNEPNEKRNN